MKRKRSVLFVSSWTLFKEDDTIEIPFIFEQIGVLSTKVRAIFIQPAFLTIGQWLVYFVNRKWIQKKESPWSQAGHEVAYYQLYLPKFPTRLTRNNLIEDFYYASYFLAKAIQRRIGFIDMVHLHTVLPLGGFVMGWQKRLGTPFILQEHSAPFEIHIDTIDKKNWVIQILNKASRVIAVGPSLLNRLKDVNPLSSHKLTLIPEMIRTDLFPVTENVIGDSINLISIGGLVERKGYDLLLHSVASLIGEGYKIRIWIVGEGTDRERLERLISDLNLEKVVNLTGKLNKMGINNLLDSCNIYVHTSYRETFGIAPTEAMLKGRPVVSTICEGPEFYINKDNGVLVEKGNIEAIVEGVKEVIQNFNVYDGDKIRSSVADAFGENKFMELMINVYSEIENG